jgi:hypothetical protein
LGFLLCLTTLRLLHFLKIRNVFSPEVGKVNLKSNGDEALSDEFLLKSNGDEALNDLFL